MADGRRLRIGIDLDNTLVCYEPLFPALARERGLIADGAAFTRIELRNHLRAEGCEHLWTELQGEAYGARMREAAPYDGAIEFLARCKDIGAPVFIVSHRSRHPYRGEAYDLHDAARQWLERRGVVSCSGAVIPRENVLLEATLGDKIAAITTLDLTHFVDDLPELLEDDRFPRSTAAILFDPLHAWPAGTSIAHAGSWNEVGALIFGKED